MTISVDHLVFRSTVADVRRAADRLRADRDRVAHRVDGLLDGGWTGAAASMYAEGWEDWKRSAEAVLSGLAAMSELLDAAHADLEVTDVGSGSGLDRIAARLG